MKANWDITRAVEQDQKQWNDLACRWLSMSHIDRSVSALLTTNFLTYRKVC